jgi:NADH-quinone oxidoreductase subunit L
MALPLVVLSVLALVGGLLDLPGHHPGFAPLGWLAPVFGSALYQAHQSAGTLWSLGIVDAAVALVGLSVAFVLWSRRAERPELEPAVLQRAYFLDDVYDAVIGRPGQAFARFCATVIEVKVIDGAVNGVGRVTRAAGGSLRRVQTGFVRQYALGIVLGGVVLLAWMLSRAVS